MGISFNLETTCKIASLIIFLISLTLLLYYIFRKNYTKCPVCIEEGGKCPECSVKKKSKGWLIFWIIFTIITLILTIFVFKYKNKIIEKFKYTPQPVQPTTTQPVQPTTTQPVQPTTQPVQPTTQPSKLTTTSKTTQPVQLTTQPSKLTTQPSKLTTQPSKLTTTSKTTQPVQPTTQPSKLTTHPSKLTTQPSKLTTQPVQLTTQPSKLTTQPVQLTTQPVQLTTQPVQLTTQPVQLTTQPSKLTTQSVQPTSISKTTQSVQPTSISKTTQTPEPTTTSKTIQSTTTSKTTQTPEPTTTSKTIQPSKPTIQQVQSISSLESAVSMYLSNGVIEDTNGQKPSQRQVSAPPVIKNTKESASVDDYKYMVDDKMFARDRSITPLVVDNNEPGNIPEFEPIHIQSSLSRDLSENRSSVTKILTDLEKVKMLAEITTDGSNYDLLCSKDKEWLDKCRADENNCMNDLPIYNDNSECNIRDIIKTDKSRVKILASILNKCNKIKPTCELKTTQ